MFVLMSIHRPHPEHRGALIESMHRYGAAISGRDGLRSIHTLADERSDRLVGIAIFESEDDYRRLAPIAREAVAEDPFEVWEQVLIDALALREV